MDELRFRDAIGADLPVITAIYNSTVASRLVTADTEPVSVASRRGWFDEHSAAFRPLWMVKNGRNDVVGWVSFQSFYGRPAYNATAEISIYLHEQARGKGYGAQILSYAVERAPCFGIKTLLGFVFSHNAPSLRLFEKFGFETWGNLPNIARLDDQEKGLLILGKRVAE